MPSFPVTKRGWFRTSPALLWWWWCWCWLAAVLFCGTLELRRLFLAARSSAGALSWLADWDAETTLPLLLLLLLPLLIRVSRVQRVGGQRRVAEQNSTSPDAGSAEDLSLTDFSPQPASGGNRGRHAVACVLLCALSFGSSMCVGWRPIQVSVGMHAQTVPFAVLPPAYHDEFSYLLQASTFRSGRLSWPAMEVQPELFHQVHVLNRPRTASRYFPWTGVWMAPFDAAGCAIIGHWTAGALACVFFFLSMASLVRFQAALIGGLLIAVSPGLAVFSNLLLAHHPTMLALSIFLWACLRMLSTNRVSDALIAGTALAVAMLGRPMTAAGFALPFGISIVMRMADGRTPLTWPRRLRLLGALGGPLLAGGCLLLWMNECITGDWLTSPYQLYTDQWTPRHRFGFNNVERAASMNRPDNVMDTYDRWATNLTLKGAVANTGRRLQYTGLWTLGVVPMMLGLLMAAPLSWSRGTDRRVQLLWYSILSQYAVHFPYWYDGIMHWHYVFETAPLLLLLCGLGLAAAGNAISVVVKRSVAVMWVGSLVLSLLLPGWVDSGALWGESKVSMAISEQSFSRVRMFQFRQLITSERVQHPCLILVDERGTDPQISYIINPPDLKSDVLVCRFPTSSRALGEVVRAFADRTHYFFNPQTFELLPLSSLPELNAGETHAARTAPWKHRSESDNSFLRRIVAGGRVSRGGPE